MTNGEPDYLVGHIDQVDEQGITGWLANMSRPDRLEDVICEDISGRTVTFRTWHPREDVCRFFGVEGRFGFVIPSAALRGVGPTVSLRDRYGSLLPNGRNVPNPAMSVTSSFHPKCATVVLHIPKTAGTSLVASLTAGLLPSDRLFIYPSPFGLSVEELACLPIEQKQAASLLIGHAMYGVGRLMEREVQYVTFLREPGQRLRSHIVYHSVAGTDFYVDGARLSVAQICNERLDMEFDNLMVRYVAGLSTDLVPLGSIDEDAVELAVSHIQRHFAFVGFADRLTTDVRRLSSVLGREMPAPGQQNVGVGGESDVSGVADIDWKRLTHRNRFDQMFYVRVRHLAALRAA